MIVRQGGGEDGVIEYLEHGKKQGRPYTRDELDERVVLAGDADATRKLIKSIDHDGEKYLHLTLSFSEIGLSPEKMKEVLDDYMQNLMPAFLPEEYLYYAEAHRAKIKGYMNETTGEWIARLDHIHLVIPNINLMSGKALNPLGRVQKNKIWLDALQEDINRRHQLVSPKDRPRVDSTTKADIIARDRVTTFKKGSFADVKAKLEQLVIQEGITDKQGLIALAKRHGEVRVRNEGKGPQREYVAIKPPGFEKFVNLSSGIFRDCMGATPRFIPPDAPNQVGVGKRTDAELDALVEDWIVQRQREIKLISTGRRKEYAEYKSLDPETRLVMLGDLEQKFYDKYLKGGIHEEGQDRAKRRGADDEIHVDPGKHAGTASVGTRAAARTAAIKQNAAKLASGAPPTSIHTMPGLHTRRLDNDAGRDQGVLSGYAGSDIRRPRDSDNRVRQPPDAERAGVERVINQSTGRAADNHYEQLLRDHKEAEAQTQDEQRALFREIKRNIDPHFLLARLAEEYGLRRDDYIVTPGESGSRIRHKDSTHNLSMNDFLTRHMHLNWRQASQLLQTAYNLQKLNTQAPIVPPPPNPAMWRQYRSARATKKIDLRPIEREAIRKAKHELKQVREQHRLEMAQLRRLRLSYAEFRTRRSRIKIEAALREKALQANMRAARERLAELNRSDPARNRYRGFLMERAQAGDLEALMELRRQRIEHERRSKLRVSAIVMIGVRTTVTLIDPTENLRYQVRRNGDVSYFNQHNQEILRDTSEAIWVIEESDDSIELALLLAQQRFGNGKFDPLGGDAFNARVVRVAAERGMQIRFQSKQFNDQFEKLRAELNPRQQRTPSYKSLEPAPSTSTRKKASPK
ncbi:LPD7 domain-containing protein [Noviherbaspirillum aerium]|uniref:LPD7 domain-containing protein n=1 Tax=Noviherbaspirillum aerium TaxID=2588497 RepID=UPI00124DB656|nr:LPD7 domain-containing protein [Noviherbaspirillum aerium]